MAKGKRSNLNDIDNSLLNYTPDDLKNFPQQFFNRFYFQTVTDQEDNYRVKEIDKVRGRVRIRIQELHRGLKDNELPWQLPLQGFNSLQGFFSVPQRGQTILVLFLHGDMMTPYYMPQMTYKSRPYMDEQERSGKKQKQGDLNQGQNTTQDDDYETSLLDPKKIEDIEKDQDEEKLKIYDFLPMDIVYEDWDGPKFGTDEGVRYNHQRMQFHMPPQWTDNDWIDGGESFKQQPNNIEDFNNPDHTQYYDDGRSGREFLDWYPQQKVQIEDIDWTRLKTIERPRYSDKHDLLIEMPPNEEKISPNPKLRLQLDSWGIMLQDELGNRKQDFNNKDKLQSCEYWPDNQNESGTYKGNQNNVNLQPARMRKMRIYSPLENELKLELDSLLKLSDTGQERTKQFDNTSNLWGQNVKNFEVWERYWHSKKEKYDDSKGGRNSGGLHEEYLMDYPFFGCTNDTAFTYLLNQEFSPLFYLKGTFRKGQQKYFFGNIWNCPDEERKHHVLVKYPEEWHIRDQVQNNDNHYDDFRRDEIVKQTNPFSWKKELFFQTKDFTREQKKWTDQKYLEFYNEVDFRTQEHQSQGQTESYDTSGGKGYSKLTDSFFDFVLKRDIEQYQYNPDKENPDGGKMEGTDGNGFSGGGPAEQRFGEKQDFLDPFKYREEHILQHDSPILNKVYSFSPENDKHYYKQDILNVLRATPTNEFGTQWSERLEDKYKKEFHSFRPDTNDHKIEYWDKENIFYQQDYYFVLEENKKLFQPDQDISSEDTNNVTQKSFKDFSNETQDWHNPNQQDASKDGRDFWKGINQNVNNATGTPRIGKLDDEFANQEDPINREDLFLQSTFKDEYMNHHEDHYTWDNRLRNYQWYRDQGIGSPFIKYDNQNLNQLKWEFKNNFEKEHVYFRNPLYWQMNQFINTKRIQLKRYDGEEDNQNFYEGFDRQYHDKDDKLKDKRKPGMDGKGPYIEKLNRETVNYRSPQDWFSMMNNDSLYMQDLLDLHIEKDNHFQTKRDSQIIQSLEFKNRKYNMDISDDYVQDNHVFDTKHFSDKYQFRYRRKNKFNLNSSSSKQEQHIDKKYYRVDTDTLMHSKVNFEIFNSNMGSSLDIDERYDIYDETFDYNNRKETSDVNGTSIEQLSNYSTYEMQQNFDLFSSEDYHVNRNIGQHYHPDDHEHQDYVRLSVFDSPDVLFHNYNMDMLFKHDSPKYSVFIKDYHQFNEGTQEWDFYEGRIHDISGSAPYINNLSLPPTGKYQYYKVYTDKKDPINYYSKITETNNQVQKYHEGKSVLFRNDIMSDKYFISVEKDIFENDINIQQDGKIWIINKNESNNDEIKKEFLDESNDGRITILQDRQQKIEGNINDFKLNTQDNGKIWIIDSNITDEGDILRQIKFQQNNGNYDIDKFENQNNGHISISHDKIQDDYVSFIWKEVSNDSYVNNDFKITQGLNQDYSREIKSTGGVSDIYYKQDDTNGISTIQQVSGIINTHSDNNTNVDSDIDINIDQDNNINISQGNNVNITQGNIINITQTTKIVITQPEVEIHGDLLIDGNVEIDGTLQQTGEIDAQGDIKQPLIRVERLEYGEMEDTDYVYS